ncbi:hypothetical protein PAXINDRAFT_27714, partial [Paxillus involutus ATCC 200175]
GHEGYIGGIAYLPGVKGVVSWSSDKTVRIWDVEKGKQEGTSMVHESWIYCIAVTRDGKRILSGGEKGKISVWDAETHESIQEWASYSGFSICCIALSPDDRCAASGDSDGKIMIREMKEGGNLKIRHSLDAGSSVQSVCFSPNGKKLASAVYNSNLKGAHVVQVYDIESGKLILGPVKGHESWIRCVLWSLDGSRLFSASDDGTIQCWNSETGKSIGGQWTRHTRAVYSLSLSPDGTKLASASCDNTVRFWDARSGDPIGHPLQHESHLFAIIRRIAYLPGGERVVSCSDDKTVRIWDVEKGKQEGTSMAQGGWIDGLAVTRDGKRVLSGGEGGKIRVWDVETHELIEEWTSHTGFSTWCISLSPDDRQLFSTSDDRTIRCWNSETGKSIGQPWTGHTREVASLSLSPKGTKLASASLDNTVRFWDVCSGDPIGHPLQHEIDQFAVAFSPSGDFVASGGKDLKISIWHV